MDFTLARPAADRLFREDPNFVGEMEIYGMPLALGLHVGKGQTPVLKLKLASAERIPHPRWDEEVGGVVTLSMDGPVLFGEWRFGHEVWDMDIRAMSVKPLTGEEPELKHWTYLEGRMFKRK